MRSNESMFRIMNIRANTTKLLNSVIVGLQSEINLISKFNNYNFYEFDLSYRTVK